MKQKAAKSAINEFGYLVNAAEFSCPPAGKLYCFYCSRPMVPVPALDNREAHFLHDLTLLDRDELIACPNLETPQTEQAS